MSLLFNSFLLIVTFFVYGAHSSPSGFPGGKKDADFPSKGKNLLQKSGQQVDSVNLLTVEQMFSRIWEKYSQGSDAMNLQQLNDLLRDTDHEEGEEVVDEETWKSLCKEKGVDPSKGLSKFDLLSSYFELPGSSIKRDFIRIFFDGAPPTKTSGKKLPKKDMEEKGMFHDIWMKYSEHKLMTLRQLNTLLRDTDQERGEQVVDEAWWRSLCTKRGADPNKGITKSIFLRLYFEMPGCSIKQDYLRVFVEGAPPQTTQGRDTEQVVTV